MQRCFFFLIFRFEDNGSCSGNTQFSSRYSAWKHSQRSNINRSIRFLSPFQFWVKALLTSYQKKQSYLDNRSEHGFMFLDTEQKLDLGISCYLLSCQRALNQFTCWKVFQIITSRQSCGMRCYSLDRSSNFRFHTPFSHFSEKYLDSNDIMTHTVNSVFCPQVGWCWTRPTLVPWATTTPWSMRWATSWDCIMSSRGWASGTPVMTRVR